MADDDTKAASHPARSVAETLKLVLVAILALALILFGVTNADDVSVDLLVTTTDLPLIFVILGSAVAGALIAALLRRRRS